MEDGPIDVAEDEQPPPNGEEVVIHAESDEVAQVPDEVPPPPLPHPSVRRRHRLTHMPYASLCKHYVEGRRNNSAHKAIRDRTRTVPCLHLVYCFLRDSKDTDDVTVAVGKFEPSQATFACGTDSKGADAYTVSRLKDFVKAQGADHFVYRTDQENSMKVCLDEGLRRLNRTAEEAKTAVPEHSAVRESQSNGITERHVQKFEDLLRTHKPRRSEVEFTMN